MNFNKIANNLRKLRNAAGLSIDELSDKSGVGKGYISDIENAEKKGHDVNPSLKELGQLATALGVSISAIMAGERATNEPYGERG